MSPSRTKRCPRSPPPSASPRGPACSIALVDGRARTSTELAVLAGVTPSTASVHLQRLKLQGLVKLLAQGKHRYYSLDGPQVAAALEALSVLAGGMPGRFEPTHATPPARRAHVLRPHRGRAWRGASRSFHRAAMAGSWRVRLQPDRQRPTVVRSPGHRCRGGGGPATPLRVSVPGLERAATASGRRARGRRADPGTQATMGRRGSR